MIKQVSFFGVGYSSQGKATVVAKRSALPGGDLEKSRVANHGTHLLTLGATAQLGMRCVVGCVQFFEVS